jgi:hypothetical protein
MHLLHDNCVSFSQLRGLEQLRADANDCARDLTLSLRDLAELRLRNLDQKEMVNCIAGDIRQAIAIHDAIVALITEALVASDRWAAG